MPSAPVRETDPACEVVFANSDGWTIRQIEDRLFAHRCRERPAPRLFRYDVTSSNMVAGRLADCWRALDLTVEEGLQELKELCATQVWVRGQQAFTTVPEPRHSTQALLAAAGIDLAAMLPRARRAGSVPNTRRKLPAQRRPRRPRRAAVDPNGSSTAEP